MVPSNFGDNCLYNFFLMNKEPNPIPFTEHIFDFDFHPSLPIVAIGLINGQVHWQVFYLFKKVLVLLIFISYNYGLESNSLAWKTQISKKSCRGVEFTKEGKRKWIF